MRKPALDASVEEIFEQLAAFVSLIIFEKN